MSIVYSTTFTGSNANPLPSPFGTMGSHSALQLLSNTCQGTATGTNCISSDTVNSASNDQYALATLGAFTNGSQLLICIRCTAATDSFIDWRIVQGSSTSNFEWRQNAGASGTFSTPALNTPGASGDTYKIQVQGQTYIGLQNNAQVFTFTDTNSELSSGSGGLGINAGTALANGTVVYFEWGSVGAYTPYTRTQFYETPTVFTQ